MLLFSQCTASGHYMLTQRLVLDVLPVPAHRLRLDCGLIQAALLGLRPPLPVVEEQLLLGNELLLEECVLMASSTCGVVFSVASRKS